MPPRSTSASPPDRLLVRLQKATARGASETFCLRRWSDFIRARDGHRCIICNSTERVAAHHVCRKSFLPEARFQTGNGATLCGSCHAESHAGFNGRADLQQPMDAQGGEKIEAIGELYRELAAASEVAHPGREDFYFLSAQVLTKFKIFQGYDRADFVPGTPIQQARIIWHGSPRNLMRAIIQANLGADFKVDLF
jgi:hypothetical protein